MRKLIAVLFVMLLVSGPAWAEAPLAKGVTHVDAYTLAGEKNFLNGYAARNDDNTINAVVEIPTGDLSKWEVRDDGRMIWELKEGNPRIVKYLGYPGNYGMIPRTLGGDKDPLDVLVLGVAQPRGAVVKARLLGVLRMTDRGETDDKLLAVLDSSPLAGANDLKELEEKFPGVVKIVTLWFENYKGKGKMQLNGLGDKDEAEKVLEEAMEHFGRK